MPLLPQSGRAVLAKARSMLGTRETSDRTHPGNVTPFGAWYAGGIFQGEAWCAIFVSWATAMAGEALPVQTPDGYSWTVAGVRFFQERGSWLPASSPPRPGDHVFFDWSPADGLRAPEHVGLVDLVPVNANGTVNTIEGNTGGPGGGPDGVFAKVRSRAVILGFGRPHYAGDLVSVLAPAPPARPSPATAWRQDGYRHPLLQVGAGMTGAPSREVLHAQRLLVLSGRNLAVDGRFGARTGEAVRLFQHVAGLAVDGQIGPASWAELHLRRTR